MLDRDEAELKNSVKEVQVQLRFVLTSRQEKQRQKLLHD